MLVEILTFILAGILFGICTGLIPGIHINLIGVFLISLPFYFLKSISPIYLVVFITSMAITHTFIDFIPSIFLGCPDTDTELSTLPGHELLLEGKGYQAIILTAYGGIAAVFILILISLPLGILISKTYFFIEKILPWILIGVSILLISLEKKKFNSITVFLITGLLGYLVLNLEKLNQPLLPLLSGLFGSSMLLISINNKIKIPEQKISKPKLKIFKPLMGAIIAAPLCSFLPGLGSGQAAIIGNQISKTNRDGFLFLLGATNTLVMGFSFISLYLISKTRTGAAVAIKELIGIPSLQTLILIIMTIFISGIISFYIADLVARFFSRNIYKINYKKVSIVVLLFLSAIIFIISGFLGLFVFCISTATGIYCINKGVRRTNMMGCLLIPTIILYLF